MSHVYFPTSAIVSLLYVTESGASAEIAVVGNICWYSEAAAFIPAEPSHAVMDYRIEACAGPGSATRTYQPCPSRSPGQQKKQVCRAKVVAPMLSQPCGVR